MEATQVPVNVRNPAEPHRTWEALFLADPGPRLHLEAIGVRSRGQRAHELEPAARSNPALPFRRSSSCAGSAERSYSGSPVPNRCSALPRWSPSASRSIPTNQRLKRLPAVSLKIDVVLPNSDSDDTGAQIHV